MFDNKLIEVWDRGSKYKNSIGQTVYKKPKMLYPKKVDVQPYSSEEMYKDYGFTVQCTKRMFCDIIDIAENTNLIKYRNKMFEITKIIEWDDFLEVALNDYGGDYKWV